MHSPEVTVNITSSAQLQKSKKSGTATIAGAVIGSISGISFLVSTAWFYMRRLRRAKLYGESGPASLEPFPIHMPIDREVGFWDPVTLSTLERSSPSTKIRPFCESDQARLAVSLSLSAMNLLRPTDSRRFPMPDLSTITTPKIEPTSHKFKRCRSL